MYDRELRIRDATRFVMSARSGRSFVWHFLESFGLFRSAFNPDPICLSNNTGKRDVAVAMYSLIEEHCPELFLTMLKEAKQEEEYDRSKPSGGSDDSDFINRPDDTDSIIS